MISIEIKGGLGNQLFQYATAKSLAHKYNSKLILDVSSFETNKYTDRNLSILELNLDNNIIINKNRFILEPLKRLPLFKKMYINFISEIENQEFSLIDLNYRKTKLNVLSGYFQSYHYFDSIRDTLLNEFQPKIKSKKVEKFEKDIKSYTNSVSLHVRRGDYINLGWELNVNYYNRAISCLSESLNVSSKSKGKILVFSDDIDWCRSNLNGDINDFDILFIQENDLNDYEELYLMSLCENNIISNSTFSWWAGWLNRNVDKQVIAPENWIKHINVSDINLIPSNWTIVKEKSYDR